MGPLATATLCGTAAGRRPRQRPQRSRSRTDCGVSVTSELCLADQQSMQASPAPGIPMSSMLCWSLFAVAKVYTGMLSAKRSVSECSAGPAAKARRLGFGGGPRRGGRRGRPTYHLNDDDVLDQNPDGNWEALDVRPIPLVAFEPSNSKAQHAPLQLTSHTAFLASLLLILAKTLSRCNPC